MPFGSHRLRFVQKQTPAQYLQARPSLSVPKSSHLSLSLSLSLSKSMLLFWAIELKAIIFLYFFLIQIEMGIG